MNDLYQGFKLAFSFLTPLPFKADYSKKNLSLMIYFFPIAGLFAGGTIFLTFKLLAFLLARHELFFLTCFSAVILLVLDLFSNNFLHSDGFCDCADALYFTKKGKDKLRILKDPHIGMFAGIWLFILLLIKYLLFYCCFLYFKRGELSPEILLVYPVAGYCIAPYLIFFLEPIFNQGLGASLKQVIRKEHLIINALLSLAIMFIFTRSAGLYLFIFSHILMLAFLKYFKYKFNGYNGDVLGFCIEITRVSVLILGVTGVEIL